MKKRSREPTAQLAPARQRRWPPGGGAKDGGGGGAKDGNSNNTRERDEFLTSMEKARQQKKVLLAVSTSLALAAGIGLLEMVALVVGSGTLINIIVLKGSVPMAFGGTQEAAAYGELVSIGGLSPAVNKKLSAGIASILESKLSVPMSRFYLKFYDSKGSDLGWNGSTF